ncbi:hypothetical protein C8Q80DRAFT_1310391 [Daedaleopsis nitida]|nr:hypothetical protein C8Q80DRAFT_1310391 [Daedaleopsis nitida]
MLSAVAARKARLAQASDPSPPAASSAPASPPPSAARKIAPSSSKRKPSASNPTANKKHKQDRKKTAQTQPARYFARLDAFDAPQEAIVVDDEDEDEDDGEGSDPQARRPPRASSPTAPIAHSEDSDDDDLDEPVVFDVPVSPPVDPLPSETVAPLSSFIPVRNQNVFSLSLPELATGRSPRQIVLLLNAQDTLALLGTYSIALLHGSVALAGVPLHISPTPHRVFAPRSSPIPLIECLPSRSSSPKPAKPIALPKNVTEAAKGYDAVVVLQDLDTGIQGLGRICRTFDGCFAPSRWHRSQPCCDLGLDTAYLVTRHTSDLNPLVVPRSWDAALSAALPTETDESELAARGCTYLVRGPKNTGKSTFARLALNRLLRRFRRVAYLECDLGQSEFTPGAMVALNVVEQLVFGPPFTHPSVPYAAHFVGATSPRGSPSHYLDSIQALIQLYHMDVRNASSADEDVSELDDDRCAFLIPLLVNTMGWTKGLGADLAHKVEEMVEPTEIFSFDTPVSEDEWRSSSHPGPHLQEPRIHVLEPAPSSLFVHYSAADHRNLSMLSYFHAVFPHDTPPSAYSGSLATRWDTSLPLCAQPPYEVDVRTAFDKLVLVGAGMEDVVPSEVSRALNCALVGLVSCDLGTLDPHPDPPMQTDDGPSELLPYEQGAAPPPPHTSRCVGLALVRAISHTSAYAQLLTPVPPRLLASARVLVMGEVQLPVWGMLDYRALDDGGDVAGHERAKVPYLRWGKGEGAGGERRRVRRNLMRRGQM